MQTRLKRKLLRQRTEDLVYAVQSKEKEGNVQARCKRSIFAGRMETIHDVLSCGAYRLFKELGERERCLLNGSDR